MRECSRKEVIMNKKATGIVAYITIIGWLVAYFVGDKENAKFHLNQGLSLGIISLIFWAIGSVVGKLVGWIPVIGWIISIVFWLIDIALLVLMIIGILNALNDQDKELPVIGKLTFLK